MDTFGCCLVFSWVLGSFAGNHHQYPGSRLFVLFIEYWSAWKNCLLFISITAEIFECTLDIRCNFSVKKQITGRSWFYLDENSKKSILGQILNEDLLFFIFLKSTWPAFLFLKELSLYDMNLTPNLVFPLQNFCLRLNLVFPSDQAWTFDEWQQQENAEPIYWSIRMVSSFNWTM